MLRSTLIAYLQDYLPEELISLYQDAMDLLESIDRLEDLAPIENVIMVQETMGQQDVITTIRFIMDRAIRAIVMEFTVVLSDEAPISLVIDVARALCWIEYYLDPQTLLNILDSDLPHQEQLAEILEKVGGVDESLFLSQLDGYSVSLLDRIRESLTPEEEVSTVRQDIIVKIKKLMIFYQHESITLQAKKMIDEGLMLGLSFTNYLDEIAQVIDSSDYQKSAQEIMFFLLLSREGTDEPIKTYQAHSQDLFPDQESITRTYSHLLRLIQTFQAFVEEFNLDQK